VSKHGIIWIGGKSRRYKASANNGKNNVGGGSKAFALFKDKPLFKWVYETIAPTVDEVHLSFNLDEQVEELNSYMNLSSDTSFVYKSILDDSSLAPKGPLLAQLTVLKNLRHISKIITISVDMPFFQTELFEQALKEEGDIVTFQSRSNILEPLASIYRSESIQLALQFISHFPFGRADDLIRGVEKVTLLTISDNYPSKIFPWNRNINSVATLGQIKESQEIYNAESDEMSFISKTVTNMGNNQEKVLKLLIQGTTDRGLRLDNHSLEQSKIIYSSLKENKSHYYAGRYAEYVGSISLKGEKEKSLGWCRKAAVSYFEEAKFWQEKHVPFIASHAFKDFEKCLIKYGRSIVDETEKQALEKKIFNSLPRRN
jgi:molybdopterin-guanine dinucleotide biosynthesis protein A